MSADVVQVRLHSGSSRLTCWVENKVRSGDQITLKNSDEPSRHWDVMTVSQPRPAGQINRGWNNNI